jgi:hypothetical protein
MGGIILKTVGLFWFWFEEMTEITRLPTTK